MNTGMALLGLVLGSGANLGVFFGVGLSWWLLIIILVESILFYIIARFTALTLFGEVMRGWHIGINSALNGVLIVALLGLIIPLPAAILIGIIIGLWNSLTAIEPISQNEVFQGFFGWLIWILPMSWLVVTLGFVFFVINLLGALSTAFQVEYLKISGLKADWKTGTFFMKGGLISNLNPIDTAFNMGNFSFVDKASSGWYMNHEAGHTLNLGAFGSVFHLIGALDENLFKAGANAYSERLAESNSGSHNVIPMWT